MHECNLTFYKNKKIKLLGFYLINPLDRFGNSRGSNKVEYIFVEPWFKTEIPMDYESEIKNA